VSTSLARSTSPELQPAAAAESRIEVFKRLIGKNLTDDELALVGAIAQRTGLDPLLKHFYAIKRFDKMLNREVMTIQIGIDGLRLMAQRSGRYAGQDGPWWCGRDLVFHDVWLGDGPPSAAKVTVKIRNGPYVDTASGTCLYSEYVQPGRDGKPLPMWRQMPANQLAKCAEAQALKKGFAREMAEAVADYPQVQWEVVDGDLPEPEVPAAGAPTPALPGGRPAGPAPAAAAEPPPPSRERVTDAQLKSIRAHLERIGGSEQQLVERLDVAELEDLDRQTAADLLRDLGKRPNAAPTAPAADDPDAPAF
jgi:phage recombination protein Bet